jgi:hypothetical protein
MMAIAVIFAISFLTPNTRTFVAFIGGCGFGWFIDELGKFITRDVNYFFHPTFALIYIVFVTMYLVFRGIERGALTPDEAVLNGLEALKSAAVGELTEARRTAAHALLAQTRPEGSLAGEVRTLLADETQLPDPAPSRFARAGHSVRTWYRGVAARSWFPRAITWIFGLAAVGSVISAVSLAFDHDEIRGFSEWASTISSIVAGLLMFVGLLRVRHHRVSAYRWFERGILVEIFVTQIFAFEQEQLAAVIGLAINVLLWISLRVMIRAELDRSIVESPPVVAS